MPAKSLSKKSLWTRLKSSVAQWADNHTALTCTAICLGVAASVIGLLAFVAFSDFGGTATFIYNQF